MSESNLPPGNVAIIAGMAQALRGAEYATRRNVRIVAGALAEQFEISAGCFGRAYPGTPDYAGAEARLIELADLCAAHEPTTRSEAVLRLAAIVAQSRAENMTARAQVQP